jgi:hypothetical protein
MGAMEKMEKMENEPNVSLQKERMEGCAFPESTYRHRAGRLQLRTQQK